MELLLRPMRMCSAAVLPPAKITYFRFRIVLDPSVVILGEIFDKNVTCLVRCRPYGFDALCMHITHFLGISLNLVYCARLFLPGNKQ
jgi:hypothetical protein